MNDAQEQDFGGTGNSNALNSGTGKQALASGDAGATLSPSDWTPFGPDYDGGYVDTPPVKKPASTPWYLSRTLWINVVALLSLLFPAVRDWLESNPVEFTAALGAVNVLLRFVTVGKYQLEEPSGNQDEGVDESAPRASHTSGVGGSSIMLMIGMSLIMMTWACSSTDNQTATSVSLTDGQVVVIRGGSSLVLDRDRHSVAWSQSTPDVVVVPPVVQATSK